MSSKRNPFNDNVNHLMEKIFSGREKAYIPQESYQDEVIPQNLRGQGGGRKNAEEKSVLHRTEEEKAQGMGRADEGAAALYRTVPKKPQAFGESGTARQSPFSEFTLRDVRSTTEKLRETTKQMQQMTLQMWAETARAQSGRESAEIRGENGRRQSIVRQENMQRYENQVGRQSTVAPKNASEYFGEHISAGENMQRQAAASCGAVFGGSKPVYRVSTPQYRMEETLDATVPERIRECKQLARSPQGCRMTKEELFYRQAQMMADYEDDCLYPGEFTWYFPTYQAMNAAQLRGYFTWRAQVRQGNVMPTSLSFAFVYVYELLHQIGAATPQEGFERLKAFWQSYREYDSQLDRYMQNWLCDYAVYYNLDRELLTQSADVAFDDALLVFLQHESHTDDEYFAALSALSKYNIEGSKFYREYPEDVRRVACGVFRALDAYYAKHGKKTLSEKYFGTRTSCAYQMFASAVFYDHKKYTDYEYAVNDIHRYRCANGRWVCEKYFGSRAKNQDMGFILRAVDARMRERYEYKPLLKQEGMTKLVMNMIEKEIDKLLEEKKKNAAPVIEIDVTKLSGIRRASELTRERLIVEGSEEMEFVWEKNSELKEEAENAPKGDAASVQPEKIPAEASLSGASGLTAAEQILLRHLLDGTPYQSFLREKHLMLSVVVDAINEKLYDQFGDTVIVFEGDTPEVLEDYAEEVKALAGGVE